MTYLRLEFAGPRKLLLIGDVDFTGDDTESHVAIRLPAVEAKISMSPLVAGAVLSLSTPDEPTLEEQTPASMAAKYVAAQIMQFGTAARG